MKAWILLIALFLLASCQKEAIVPVPEPSLKDSNLNLPAVPYRYGLNARDEIVTLGRVLFYDKRLSSDNTVSCASCHKQSLGFSDNVAFSNGVNGQHTVRNSLSIQDIPNVNSSLFWDGRETTLEKMVLMPLANEKEMGVNVDLLVSRLNEYQEYRKLFKDAYGNTTPNKAGLAFALAWFVRSLKMDFDRFDLYLKSNSNNNVMQEPLTQQELRGYTLFVSEYNCNRCHKVEDKLASSIPNSVGVYGAGTLGNFANIGLEIQTTDPGIKGKYKIPSLRNVALTAPYMHDGRFKTLDQVINHYSTGIQQNISLALELKEPNGLPKKFNITPEDRDALVAFLGTLTDKTMTTNVRFSDPFKNN